MNMNEAYRCLDGIRGPRVCLSRPTSASTWHQVGLFDCGKYLGYLVQGLYAVRLDWRGEIAPHFIPFHPMSVEKSF